MKKGSNRRHSGNSPQSNNSNWTQIFSAYRIFFSCAHVGKVVPSSKRVVLWKFGFSNEQAIGDGLVGTDCLGEEHEVKLTWSVRSGRVQVLYNSRDITSLGTFMQNAPSGNHGNSFGFGGLPKVLSAGSDTLSHGSGSSIGNASASTGKKQSRGRSLIPKIPLLSRDVSNESNSQDSTSSKKSASSRRSARSASPSAPSFIEFTWRTSAHHSLTIRAHVSASPGYQQYELLVDGRSFLSLPTAYELGTKEYIVNYREDFSRKQFTKPVQNPNIRENSRRSPSPSRPLQQQNQTSRAKYSTEDELNNDVNVGSESLLDIIRHDVESTVPGTDMMMSRAIICAFSEDRDLSEILPTNSTKARAREDEIVYETDCIYAANEWMKWNARSSAHDNLDRKCAFLQTQINKMVACVRHNLISPVAASQAIHSVAAVLDMELAVPLPRNTIVLFSLNKYVTREHVVNALKIYGKIEGAAVASGNKGFALCRYKVSKSCRRALEASFRDEIIIHLSSPQVHELSQLSSSIVTSPPKKPHARRAHTTSAMPNENGSHQHHNNSHTINAAGIRSYQRQLRQQKTTPENNMYEEIVQPFATTRISAGSQKQASINKDDDLLYNSSFEDFNKVGLVRRPSLDESGRYHLESTDFPYDVGEGYYDKQRSQRNTLRTFSTFDDDSPSMSRSKVHGNSFRYDSVSEGYGEF